ncbi:MAG: tetratricopeptide repeat protein [Byssovorax sp.]
MKRRSIAVGLACVVLSAAGCAYNPALEPESPEQPPAAPPAVEAPGSWIPPYTPAQLAILAPVDHPVSAPAVRILPDLARFAYGTNRAMRDPEEALKLTRMVAAVLDDSPRFYAISAASADLANPLVQYGPPADPEADGFVLAKRGEGGVAELGPAPLDEAAKASYVEGTTRAGKGDWKGAVEAFNAAVAKSPKVPALHVAVADALVMAGDDEAAEQACQRAIALDPTFASAYLTLAEIAERRHDGLAARPLAEALAYQPSSIRAQALAVKLGGGGKRIAPFSVLLDVDSVGAIHAAGPGQNPGLMYAGCRGVMRYEPEVRAQIFEEPKGTPYYLSVVEEVVCVEAALGAYMVDRRMGHARERDERLEALIALAQEDGLAGYVLFEILGPYRPERARSAPPDMHRAVVRYVERHVLGQKSAPEGVYNAGLSPMTRRSPSRGGT